MPCNNIPAKHVMAGDVLGGKVVESVRYVSGELLVFYRRGGQQTFPLNARVTVNR
jgi:hypothetical protein